MVKIVSIIQNKFSDLRRYAWLIDFCTAFIIIGYMGFIGYAFVNNGIGLNYYKWRRFLTIDLLSTSLSIAFLLSVCWQAWLSMEELIEYYFATSSWKYKIYLGIVSIIILCEVLLGLSLFRYI